jgi:hypothetical protein
MTRLSDNGTVFAKSFVEKRTMGSQGPTTSPTVFSGQVLPMTCSGQLVLSEVRERKSPETVVVEIPILVPEWQAAALEDAANDRGLTVGELVRHMLADYFAKPGGLGEDSEMRKNESQARWR